MWKIEGDGERWREGSGKGAKEEIKRYIKKERGIRRGTRGLKRRKGKRKHRKGIRISDEDQEKVRVGE